METAQVVIPTYNRSAKLARTLECYAAFRGTPPLRLVVLDGSSPEHQRENQRQSEKYSNVEYLYRPDLGFIARVLLFLERQDPRAPVCLGTDEDVFFPGYLQAAKSFLDEHPDYSMLVGRYYTFLRPLGFLHRLSHHRDVLTRLDIRQDDMARRVALLGTAISVGCAPVFWGVRRAGHFVQSLSVQKRLEYQTSQEVIDQILLAWQGKVRLVADDMLLRDETNLDYVRTDDREDKLNYFPPSEHDSMLALLEELGGRELAHAGAIYADRFRPEYMAKGTPCITVQDHAKAYCKYEPLRAEGRDSGLYRGVTLLMKSATVIAEVLTAMRDVRVLKSVYGEAPIEIFERRVRSNQLS